MSFTEIFTIYEKTPNGASALQYAADIANRCSLPLTVFYLSYDKSELPSELERNGANKIQATRIREEVERLTAEHAVDVSCIGTSTLPNTLLVQGGPGTLVIQSATTNRYSGITTLYPYGEPAVENRYTGNILIPFGDKQSSKVTISKGVDFAKQLQKDVVFYHTTWHNDDIISGNPEAHMNAEAKQLWEFGMQSAKEAGLNYRSIIETSMSVEDVASGINRAALSNDINIITTALDPYVIRGDYTLQLLENSRIPIVIFGGNHG